VNSCEMNCIILMPGVTQSMEEPCGAPATIRCWAHWMCAECYDLHARLMAQFGFTPEGEPLSGVEIGGRKSQY
jgi:hypothetical protein